MQGKCYSISLEKSASPVAQESYHKQKRAIKNEESRTLQVGSIMRKVLKKESTWKYLGNSEQCKIKYSCGGAQ